MRGSLLPQSSPATSLFALFEGMDLTTGTTGAKCFPLQVCDPLRNIIMHNSMGPDEMHPIFIRKLINVVAKPLFMILVKSWHSEEVSGDWNGGNIV